MCPDRQMLSVYLDNELPSPWKEKMEAHVSQCTECQKLLKQYQFVSNAVHPENNLTEPRIDSAEERAQERAQKRVWENLSLLDFGEKKRISQKWNRSVSLPLPAAAAAALVIAFMAAFIGNTFSRSQNVNTIASLDAQPVFSANEAAFEARNMITSADLARIIQYLDEQEKGSNMMIINLPETEDFTISGEPALIRAADYSRRDSFR